MNKTSADKIKLATPFLSWFRQYLPQPLQVKIRPHLDRPYQLALNILDSCDSRQPRTVREISQLSGVAQETARQVLQSLKDGGMAFAVSPTHGWQAFPEGESGTTTPSLPQLSLPAQELSSEPAMTTQGL